MRRLKLTIEFDGTDFLGWQRQPAGERTIQGVFDQALARLPGEHSGVHGAGRTDAGVHALAMVGHLDTSLTLAPERLRLALNAHLPPDVKVLEVSEAPENFEAQYSCTYRRYLYRMRVMRDEPRGLALERRRTLAVHRHMDVAAMQEAAMALEGRHDFASFATQESRNTERTLYLCRLREERGELRLHVAANGFLRGMVRAITGTLLWVGKGKLQAADIPDILAARNRIRAGHAAAAHGLYFVEAGYAEWDPDTSESVAHRRILW